MSTAEKAPSDRQRLFVLEYLVDLNAYAAAVRAGYTSATAKRACTLLEQTYVKAEVQKELARRESLLVASIEDVMLRLSHIAICDRSELVEIRRECCRYCYGNSFRYQRTPGEIEAAREVWEKGDTSRPFDAKGGIGYTPNRVPHPDCPECFGRGVLSANLKDTRLLSDAAKTVFGGVRITKDGIQIVMESRIEALDRLARYHGLFKENLRVEHTLSRLSDEELDTLEALLSAASAS